MTLRLAIAAVAVLLCLTSFGCKDNVVHDCMLRTVDEGGIPIPGVPIYRSNYPKDGSTEFARTNEAGVIVVDLHDGDMLQAHTQSLMSTGWIVKAGYTKYTFTMYSPPHMTPQ